MSAKGIIFINMRVKKLEKKGGSRTHKLKRLYKVGRSIRIVSSDELYWVIRRIAIPNREENCMTVIKMMQRITLVDETQVSVASITDVEITLAQALAELKSAKPTTAARTRPRAKGLVIHEEEQATTPIKSQPLSIKLDEEVAERLQAEFDEQESIEREKAEANIALKETWDNIQTKIEVDCLLAERLANKRRQEELTIEEKAKLFQQLLEE
ncbi:hypothetical protein Tco_0761669 [Tanacetum coccineum]